MEPHAHALWDDASRREARGGWYYGLVDEQVRVGPRSTEHYLHRARVIETRAGVASGSELTVRFDPAYERLVLHAVRVHRGGLARNALTPGAVRSFQEESDLDRRVYNGTTTVLVVPEDVRAGDVFEYELTIEGRNPVFAGSVSETLELGAALDASELHVRFLAPVDRALSFQRRGDVPSSIERVEGGYRETSWHLFRVPAHDDDGDAPAWFEPVPRVSISELATWQAVARWGVGLFEVGGVHPSVEALAQKLREAHATEDERIVAATRFVQDEVRYFGVELGEGSHRPRPPAEVLSRRFGDCKDKALLLVHLLRALGAQAQVALVHTSHGAALPDALPSPVAFNHAIVRVQVGGVARWIDATQRNQGGNLASMSPPPFEQALVLSHDTTALEKLPEPPRGPTMVAREVYSIEGGGPAARLEVETTFTGSGADAIRDTVQSTPRGELAKRSLNYYAEVEPGVASAGELDIADDRERNVVVLRERYTIADYLRDDQACFNAGTLQGMVDRPGVTRRSSPLALRHPYRRRHEVEVRWDAPTVGPSDITVDTNALAFSRASTVSPGVARVVFEASTKRAHVDVADVAGHLRAADTIRDALGGCVAVATAAPPPSSAGSPRLGKVGFLLVATGGMVVCFLFVAVVVPRIPDISPAIRRARWRRKLGGSSGELAAQPRFVRSRDEAVALLRKVRCGCARAVGREGAISWSTMRVGEQQVTCGSVACACGEVVKRYFAIEST